MFDVSNIQKVIQTPGAGEKLGAALLALLDVYVTGGARGADVFAVAVDELMETLKDTSDPLVKQLTIAERLAIWAAVNPFKVMKERNKRECEKERKQQDEAEAAEGGSFGVLPDKQLIAP